MDDAGRGFIYDRVAYPSLLHEVETPDQIAAAGQFYGWRSADPARASVLEIGCFDGINMIAIAAGAPHGRCVGFDLSGTAIARGRELAHLSGIGNVELLRDDILSFPRTGERFDYIVCHGVLSWVPPAVRRALFEIVAGRLAPGGVAYIGYDALPGAASKAAIVEFLCQLVSEIDDPDERVDTAVSLIEALARNQHRSSRLAPQLDELVRGLPTYQRAYFLHDWLVPAYAPLSVGDFADMAAEVGLGYAGDIRLADLYTGDIDQSGHEILAANAGSLVSFAATLDLLRGSRMYRTDMLVRPDAPPPPSADQSLTFAFTGQRNPAGNANSRPAVHYAKDDLRSVTLVDDAQIAVADFVANASPVELSVAEVAAGAGIDAPRAGDILRRLALIGVFDVHATPQPFVASPGERPRAGRLARGMVPHGTEVVSLRHGRVSIDDALQRHVLALCDGTRSRDDLVRAVAGDGAVVTREGVDAAIAALARLRLFEA